MNVLAFVIREYAQTHTEDQTAAMIGRLLDKRMPKDDHGHFYKEAGAPCPHHAAGKARKPRNALKNEGKNGKIYRVSRMASREKKKEKNISRQTERQIQKGIGSLEKHIQKHEHKISHPEEYYADWDTYSSEEKKRRLRHWEHEIEVAHLNIQNRRAELERRERTDE